MLTKNEVNLHFFASWFSPPLKEWMWVTCILSHLCSLFVYIQWSVLRIWQSINILTCTHVLTPLTTWEKVKNLLWVILTLTLTLMHQPTIVILYYMHMIFTLNFTKQAWPKLEHSTQSPHRISQFLQFPLRAATVIWSNQSVLFWRWKNELCK